ncbi:MAG: DUF2062 domain-containing protein [Myxococcales bacterium]|nr:DUF2062 domain-containing protein [Myxococcales bacterium]
MSRRDRPPTGPHKPRSPRVRKLRALLAKAFRQHTSPPRLALAVAIGVFIGCTPLFGLHSVIAIGIAALFGLNTVAAFAGTQISIPPLAPLLAFASIQLGGLILGTSGDLTFDAIRRTELTKVFARFSTAWLVGSVGVGLTLAIIAYLLTYLIAKRRHGRDEE